MRKLVLAAFLDLAALTTDASAQRLVGTATVDVRGQIILITAGDVPLVRVAVEFRGTTRDDRALRGRGVMQIRCERLSDGNLRPFGVARMRWKGEIGVGADSVILYNGHASLGNGIWGSGAGAGVWGGATGSGIWGAAVSMFFDARPGKG